MNPLSRRLPAVLLVAALCALPASAQQALDRSKVPPAGKAPALRVPTWTKVTLANGAEVFVSEKRGLPLVSFTLTWMGGADQFEPADRRGVASLAASMLSEGTTTRDGEALSNALQMLGTSVQLTVDSESGSMGFVSTTGKFAPTLDILADMLLRSTFPAPALERLRAQWLVALDSAKAQPGEIASRVFPKVLYGTGHPFGQLVTEAMLKAITRDDVMAFHKNYFQPGRAAIVVVGDVTPASARAIVEKALAAWPAGGSRPTFTYPPPPAKAPTTIYLVDKPGAAQSTFAIGLPGPPRSTPDYFAIQVMNTLLGGMFQSRLNANIREEKGLSYGVARVRLRQGPRPVPRGRRHHLGEERRGARRIHEGVPWHPGQPAGDRRRAADVEELAGAEPAERFASVSSIGAAIGALWQRGLPDDYYQQYQKAINAVTKADVVRVAKQYIDLGHLSIVIVGDRATIEGPLKATGIAPIVGLDIEGNKK